MIAQLFEYNATRPGLLQVFAVLAGDSVTEDHPGAAHHHAHPDAVGPGEEDVRLPPSHRRQTSRDAPRCLKRAVCRQLFKILERSDRNTGTKPKDLPQAA